MASGALAVFVVISLLLASRLSEANHLAAAREKMTCRASVESMRKKDAGYLAIEAALGKLVADPAKSIDSGFGPFLSTALLHADITGDPDYQRVLVPFIVSISDFRAGSTTADKLGSAADNLMVVTKKADGKLRTLLNATLPQGC